MPGTSISSSWFVSCLWAVLVACAWDPASGPEGVDPRRRIQAATPSPWEEADRLSNATPRPAPDLYRIVTVRRKVDFLVYESGFADSDTVRIAVNGQVVPGFESFDAAPKPATFSVDIADGLTRVTMTALTNGACDPNTTCMAPHPLDVRGRNVRAGGWFPEGHVEGFLIEYVAAYSELRNPLIYFTPAPY
ncbi:MAG: hypothetical protein VKP72_11315 [bacterium]|nr:hypothetical protein [bacterium]